MKTSLRTVNAIACYGTVLVTQQSSSWTKLIQKYDKSEALRIQGGMRCRYPIRIAPINMGPIAFQSFDQQRVSGRRPMSDHGRFVSDLIDREIRIRHARLPIRSRIHRAELAFKRDRLASDTFLKLNPTKLPYRTYQFSRRSCHQNCHQETELCFGVSWLRAPEELPLHNALARSPWTAYWRDLSIRLQRSQPRVHL